MAVKKTRAKRAVKKAAKATRPVTATAVAAADAPAVAAAIPPSLQEFLKRPAAPAKFVNPRPLELGEVRQRLIDLGIHPTVPTDRLVASLNRIKPDAAVPEDKRPEEIRASARAMKPQFHRFHGAKIALSWFPFPTVVSSCADKFGYMSSAATRAATKLPFNVVSMALLGSLGDMMGDAGHDPNQASQNPADAGVSSIPSGYTYFGQFVDHDVTLDVSSTLDADTDATTINNMRSPALDLDSLYSRGPGLDPFLYVFPTSGPATAVKFLLGTNTPSGVGGPGGGAGFGGMIVQKDYDVPRVPGTLTAAIGDPRNDENLIVVQFHQSMLRFHNAVVDLLVAASFSGDIFAEAKRIVTHHYQWAVVNDYLKRICGAGVVSAAMSSVVAPVGSSFRMPVEFAVAAYRFGHSMIRDNYWVNFVQIFASLGDVFAFNRVPRLPVLSNWVVDFNAFFDTGIPVPVHNKARRIDSALAVGLESLPGFSGMMAVLATRNLRRGLALGLPSGQGMASQFGVAALTPAQLTSGLPATEVALLNSSGGVLLKKTPLWYYVLREAAVLNGGNQLGPVGGRIVAETFARMLKRDASSFVNVGGGFTPFLPSAAAGDFTVADLVTFAGVTQP